MSYTRVLPRDLFNESKLLKCMGQLLLFYEDGCSEFLTIEHDCENGFNIVQDDSDGSLTVTNISVYTKDGTQIHMSSLLNCKSNYPLQYNILDEVYGMVFTSDGKFTEEFKDLIGGNA